MDKQPDLARRAPSATAFVPVEQLQVLLIAVAH